MDDEEMTAREVRYDELLARGAKPFVIPRVATVKVCDRIEPEQMKGEDDRYSPLDARYAMLTGRLPLHGAEAMARDADGATRIDAALRVAAPWMSGAAAAIRRQVELALWLGNPWLKLRPLLLVGGPGTGKSHFARALAETSGCHLVQLPLGGDSDNRALGGTARGWLGTQPALPIIAMAQGRTANPLVVLDEIDKVSPDKRLGNVHDTLLSMLEPVTASAWYDRCLMAAVDLRHVVWVGTANSVHALPPVLLSRFDVVEVSAPGASHAPALIDGLTLEIARGWGVPAATLPPLPAGAEGLLVRHFSRTRSIRQLRRGLETALAAAIEGAARTRH